MTPGSKTKLVLYRCGLAEQTSEHGFLRHRDTCKMCRAREARLYATSQMRRDMEALGYDSASIDRAEVAAREAADAIVERETLERETPTHEAVKQ